MTEMSQVLLEYSSWPSQDDVFLSVTSENSAVVFPTAVPSGIRFLIKLEVIVQSAHRCLCIKDCSKDLVGGSH